MVHVYFCIHVKCTKSTCFCSENTVKTHENTSKTVHFMYKIWYMCILVYMFLQLKHLKKHKNTSERVHSMYEVWYMCIFVYMYHVQKVHVCAVKTQWKHMKPLAKQCISGIKYGTCVFLYTCTMCQKYMFLQYKHSENTWKH